MDPQRTFACYHVIGIDKLIDRYLQAKTHKDKLLLYILIMALTMNNYTVQLAELASDLKKSPLTYDNIIVGSMYIYPDFAVQIGQPLSPNRVSH